MLCLGQILPEMTEILCEYEITQTIGNLEIAKQMSEIAQKLQKKLKVHLKIDTGMGRIGFYWPEEGNIKIQEKNEVVKEIMEITKLPGLEVEGIFTHLACAENEEISKKQINKFKEILEYLSKSGIKFKIAHCSSSIGIIKYPDANFDMVRAGRIFYGLAVTDSGYLFDNLKLHSIFTMKTRICTLRNLSKGSTIGYGCNCVLQRDSKIAVLPFGYADGVPKTLCNRAKVKIKGQLCPLLGTICMDMAMADVTDIKEEIQVGDIVTVYDHDLLLKDSQLENIEFYGLTTRILPRTPIIYIDKGKMIVY